MAKKDKPRYEHLRLTDCIEPGVRLLLIGINPGVMSALTGHHFAGPTNRFWGLLYESGIVPEPITHEDDVRLPLWGIGMTNLVARPTPGIDTLNPQEYVEGWKILERKIDRFRPQVVAFVGVTMYRALAKILGHARELEIKPGFQHATVHGARIFVLPNPSGRNAHFSYEQMLSSFSELARSIRRLSAVSSTGSTAGAGGRSRRAAGTAARTTPSTPAAARPRTANRTRAGSRS